MKKKNESEDLLLSADDRKMIINAIEEAELNTSGEIRVRVERFCKDDVLDRAAWWFKKLNMHKTELRNGVLIYVAAQSRLSAIIGDKGIHAKLGNDFWNLTHAKMIENFSKGHMANGIAEAVAEVGARLKAHFPYNEELDKNELSNEISMEE